MYARRAQKYAAPSTGIIVGKPTAAFSPRTGHAYFPNASCCFLTNLVAGSTSYLEDEVSGTPIVDLGGGSFGSHTDGEGYRKTVNSTTSGIYASPIVAGTDSWAFVVEFSADAGGDVTFTYGMGLGTSFRDAVGAQHSACAFNGLFNADSQYVCLPSIRGQGLVRVGVRLHRLIATKLIDVWVDGQYQGQITEDRTWGSAQFNIGRNQYGTNIPYTWTGFWAWTAPFDGALPLSDQAMIDLTTDPWPYLAVLD